MTLKTVTDDNKSLEKISICIDQLPDNPGGPPEQYEAYQELDSTLVQLWESRSIRPRLLYNSCPPRQGVRASVEDVFPELMKQGAADLVDLVENGINLSPWLQTSLSIEALLCCSSVAL